MLVLTPIWALVQGQDNGAFERFSTHSNPGDWEPSDLLRGSHLGVSSVAIDAVKVYFDRPTTEAEIDREAIERLTSRPSPARQGRPRDGRAPPHAYLGARALGAPLSVEQALVPRRRRLRTSQHSPEPVASPGEGIRWCLRRTHGSSLFSQRGSSRFPEKGVVHPALGRSGRTPTALRGKYEDGPGRPPHRQNLEGVPPPRGSLHGPCPRSRYFQGSGGSPDTPQRRHTRYRSPSFTTAFHRWNPSRQSSLPITVGPS